MCVFGTLLLLFLLKEFYVYIAHLSKPIFLLFETVKNATRAIIEYFNRKETYHSFFSRY